MIESRNRKKYILICFMVPHILVGMGTLLAYPDTTISEPLDELSTPIYELNDLPDLSGIELVSDADDDSIDDSSGSGAPTGERDRIITDIVITGNTITPTEAILSYVPYRIGEIFDAQKSKTLIRNVYYNLPRFSTITVKGKPIGSDTIEIHVELVEKPVLKGVILEACGSVTDAEIRKKVNFDVPAIEDAELPIYAQRIKKVYLDRGYCEVTVESRMQLDNDGKALITFTINEGARSAIRRILFKGNESVSDKKLRSIIFTQEDWLLGFLSKAGIYHPDRIEADKHMIEQHYQNNGFLHAKVVAVDQYMDPVCKDMDLTFVIEEGPKYCIGKVSAPGNDILSEDLLLGMLPVRSGQPYSRQNISDSMKQLEAIWGSRGNIFARVEPSIQPNDDEKTVDVTLYSDVGEQIYLNRVTIRGNRKTRDKVIRRKILLREGELLTNDLMDFSRNSVQALGFFDQREGVNWKTNRLTQDTVDLDLVLKEAKTGNFNLQLGYGGSFTGNTSPDAGVNAKVLFSDRNWMGYGLDLSSESSWSKKEVTFSLHAGQPWLFDRPIYGGLDVQHRRPAYDMFRNIKEPAINERTTTGSVTTGVIVRSSNQLFNGMQALGSIGIDHIAYQERPTAAGLTPEAQILYQQILNSEFKPGAFAWIGGSLEHDVRNHPVHTSQGHKWRLAGRLGIPHGSRDNIGYAKFTADASWFTPLINEYDLVFRMRFFAGAVMPLLGHVVPYTELFNIGGPASVRGFLFGTISPRFEGDPIGGGKAMYCNFELLFPIMSDMSMKGAFFYDGGTGFANPHINPFNKRFATDNNFDYRHSVGFSIRVQNPMPIRVDWGFKIDPRKGEPSNEVHFGMNYDW